MTANLWSLVAVAASALGMLGVHVWNEWQWKKLHARHGRELRDCESGIKRCPIHGGGAA